MLRCDACGRRLRDSADVEALCGPCRSEQDDLDAALAEDQTRGLDDDRDDDD